MEQESGKTSITLAELARLVEGELNGDGDLRITGAAVLRDAGPGEITLADSSKQLTQLAASAASAAIVPEGVQPTGLSSITVAHVHRAFARIVTHFRPPRRQQGAGIRPGAQVSPTARIGPGAQIYPGATIGDEVEIGAHSVIHSGARILAGCRLGQEVTVQPNAVLYEDTRVGDRAIIHAGAVIGAYGFGYETVDGRHRLSAQLGYVEIGADVEIGACTTVDRGTYGPTVIGEGTKIDNQVMIAHNCRIGRHNLICSQVGIAGSCTTGDYVVLAGQVGVRDHVQIGDGAVLGAQAGVINDVPGGGAFLGAPAIPEREQMVLVASLAKLPEMRKQLKAIQRALDSLQRPTSAAAD